MFKLIKRNPLNLQCAKILCLFPSLPQNVAMLLKRSEENSPKGIYMKKL